MKICQNKYCIKVWICKLLPEVLPIWNYLQQGDALRTTIFRYAITKIQVSHVVLKLYGTHRILVYSDNGNLLGEIITTTTITTTTTTTTTNNNNNNNCNCVVTRWQ
jgi:hypothetical protein